MTSRRQLRSLLLVACVATIGCASHAVSSESATAVPTPRAATEAPPQEPLPPPEPPPEPPPYDVLTLDGSLSTSIGAPNDGRLEGGIPFPDEGLGYRLNPRRPNEGGRFGTVETVQAIVRAAAVVEAELPGSKLVFNDTSLEHGGPIVHHGSHQVGRDIDVLFFLIGHDGEPFPSKGVPIDPHGRGIDFNDLMNAEDDIDVRLDVPRTWRFVQALIEAEGTLVQRIFVVEHIRTMLLEHATRTHAPRAVIARFEDATCQPNAPHDDHLHVRFFCTAEDIRGGCLDGTPMYPFRRAELREQGVEPAMASMRRTPEARERTVSEREARAAAPPMLPRVRAYLRERESWTRQPHPGRRYCR